MQGISESDEKYALKRRDKIEIEPEFAKLLLELKK